MPLPHGKTILSCYRNNGKTKVKTAVFDNNALNLFRCPEWGIIEGETSFLGQIYRLHLTLVNNRYATVSVLFALILFNNYTKTIFCLQKTNLIKTLFLLGSAGAPKVNLQKYVTKV
jgi:hypothetical protein